MKDLNFAVKVDMCDDVGVIRDGSVGVPSRV
jgi:hypothetical protein